MGHFNANHTNAATVAVEAFFNGFCNGLRKGKHARKVFGIEVEQLVYSFFVFGFITFSLVRIETLLVSIVDSLTILAVATFPSRGAILASKRPWASLAASYSAFSLRSPFSLASAIALDAAGRSTLLK